MSTKVLLEIQYLYVFLFAKMRNEFIIM